jgi:uncharacterized protein YbjQ (UPF0145 family)
MTEPDGRQVLSPRAETHVETLSGESEPHRPFQHSIPVSTADYLPGYEVTAYVGEVFGIVDRSRRALPQVEASLKSVVSVELEAPNPLQDPLREAIERMAEEAEKRGANAVIGLRLNSSALGDATNHWSGVCAYGTAVRARRVATWEAPLRKDELEENAPALDRFRFASGAIRVIGGFVAMGSGLLSSEELGGVISHSTAVAVLAGIVVFVLFWFAALVLELLTTIAATFAGTGGFISASASRRGSDPPLSSRLPSLGRYPALWLRASNEMQGPAAADEAGAANLMRKDGDDGGAADPRR